MPKITKYGISVQASGWDKVSDRNKAKIEKTTDKIAGKLSKNHKPGVGIKTKALFSMIRMMQNKGWGSSPAEKEYWQEKGWLDKKRPWKQHKK